MTACRASLKGGWDRGQGDRGTFGVTLHLGTPAALMLDMDKDYGPDPRWPAPIPAPERTPRTARRDATPDGGIAPLDMIAKLADLRDKGVITPADYEAKKAELLARL